MPPENAAPAPRARTTPLSPGRFDLRVTIDDETQDLLQRARALMSHQIPTGEIAPVLKSALRLFVTHHEQRKYAATSRPRPLSQGTASNPRHIPASVKRAVRERDGDQCAFVSESGQRCSSRTRLEFDHIEPVSRGGDSTVENLRLVCRAHNQYAAERAFGAEFMEQKRTEARRHA
jgi:5-methylcytosine-specific restriction endonuclease McrA